MRLLLFAALVRLSVEIGVSSILDWTYNENDRANGPLAWGKHYAECAGTKNSPIDIDTYSTVKKQAPNWILTEWSGNHKWNVSNVRDTVRFDLADGSAFTTSGGGMSHVYDLIQFHFHWGRRDNSGSEHTVDGEGYAMEVHFVHKKSIYQSFMEAVRSNRYDAIAVMGFFLEVQEDDNLELTPLIQAVTSTKVDTEMSNKYAEIGRLTSLIHSSLKGNYWRYNGSLTVPECNQEVVWSVFATPIGISHNQVEAFRSLDHGVFGDELHRPTQPLYGRRVIEYQADENGPDFMAFSRSSRPAVCLLYMGISLLVLHPVL